MDGVRIIEIKKSVFENNDLDANNLRKELKSKGVYLLNLMSSPGSGKTTTLIRTINLIKDKLRLAVMEADIDSDVDAIKIKEATGVDSIQLHTGGMCHPVRVWKGCRLRDLTLRYSKMWAISYVLPNLTRAAAATL